MSDQAWWFLCVGVPLLTTFFAVMLAGVLLVNLDSVERAERKRTNLGRTKRNTAKWEVAYPGCWGDEYYHHTDPMFNQVQFEPQLPE